jgi:hypothetical protein
MNRVQPNNLIKLYYKTNNLASGKTIYFNVWKDDSTQIVTNQTATEIGTNGLYYIDFTTPPENTYLMIKSGLSTEKDERPIILANGSVSEKIFYVDEKFISGKSIPYMIYNIFDIVHQSGTLFDEDNGFYSVDVSALSEGTYFFKVEPFTSKFVIPLDLEFVPGECVATVETRYITVNVSTSLGGASKGKHSYFPYEESKREINAVLLYDSDGNKSIVIAYIDSNEEAEFK